MITWTERIITAEDSWRENEDLPTFLRMDRAFKAAGVRDLITERDDLIQSGLRIQQEAFDREIKYTAENVRLKEALEKIRKQAEPRDWETPGHPMNEWTKREPILRLIDEVLNAKV